MCEGERPERGTSHPDQAEPSDKLDERIPAHDDVRDS